MRMSMSAGKNNIRYAKTLDDAYIYPLTISRATSRMDDVRKFYSTSVGVTEIFSKTYDDGTELVIMQYDSPGPLGEQMQFWQNRPSANPSPKYTVKMFEDYMHKVHNQVMVDELCGFDQWIDNHYGYNGNVKQMGPLSLDLFTQHAKSLGYPYHLWNVAGKIQAYVVDPTGYGV